jgi:hypothetical protein
MNDGARNFKNERGNQIGIMVIDQVINGVDGVLISIEGPNSKTEAHITRVEAQILLEELQAHLSNKRHDL